MSRRPPHRCCVICERSLLETGGVRLVTTPFHAIQICRATTLLGDIRHPSRTARLDGKYRDVILVFSGERVWTGQVVRRAEAAIEKGYRPWFCQRCGRNNLCPVCQTPLTTTPATDWIDDEGRTIHSAYFTGSLRECPNPQCGGP